MSGKSIGATPVILIGGVAEAPMLATMLTVQLGLPEAVAVRHVIDGQRQVLIRIVSDVNGILEQEEISLSHACVACAIREDVVPTLRRLAAMGRWSSIVAALPVGAEAIQVCRVLAVAPRGATPVRVAAVIAALEGGGLARDLLGDDLLHERGVAISPHDRRGVGEVGCAMVEYADLVALSEAASEAEFGLVAALARPGIEITRDGSTIDGAAILHGLHSHRASEAWISAVRRDPLPALTHPGAWRMDLIGDRPIHPLRFHEELSTLGEGSWRMRGCFWLPTRPRDVCVWEGAGGQVSIGATQQWHSQEPFTRLVVTGLGAATSEQEDIRAAFARCLVTDAEISCRGTSWRESRDGLEPWLGPIESAA